MKLAISLCATQIMLAASVAARLRVSPGTPAPTTPPVTPAPTMAAARPVQVIDPLLLAKAPTGSPTRGSRAGPIPISPLANLVIRGAPSPNFTTFGESSLTCTVFGAGGTTGAFNVAVPSGTIRTDATNFSYNFNAAGTSDGLTFNSGAFAVAVGTGPENERNGATDGTVLRASVSAGVVPVDGTRISCAFRNAQGATLLSNDTNLSATASSTSISLAGGFVASTTCL
jgi:hypothetical protein